MKEIVIGDNEAGKKLHKLLERVLCKAPKSFIYKMLRKKNITLNGRKASGDEILKVSDTVKIFLSDETFLKMSVGEDMNQKKEVTSKKKISTPDIDFKSRIIYEDADIIIANKPKGVLSQQAVADDISMNELLVEYMKASGQIDDSQLVTFRPSFVNRLDRNTSGLMLAGKSYKGLRELSSIISDRSVSKYYLTVVSGNPKDKAKLHAYLKKDEKTNKVKVSRNNDGTFDEIITQYECIKRKGNVALLKVKLVTGKTHQIRAHLSFEGMPVIGGVKYGNKDVNEYYKKNYNIKSQMLHSYEIIFPDCELETVSGKSFKTKIPDEFKKITG